MGGQRVFFLFGIRFFSLLKALERVLSSSSSSYFYLLTFLTSASHRCLFALLFFFLQSIIDMPTTLSRVSERDKKREEWKV